MAYDSAKKVARKNNKILISVRIALAASFALHLLLLYVFREKATIVSICVSGGHYALALIIYQTLYRFSRGEYDANGRLVYGGTALSGLVVNIAFDILYIALLSFVISPITPKIYWVDFFIIVSVIYGFWFVVIKPMSNLSNLQEEVIQNKTSTQPVKRSKRIKY